LDSESCSFSGLRLGLEASGLGHDLDLAVSGLDTSLIYIQFLSCDSMPMHAEHDIVMVNLSISPSHSDIVSKRLYIIRLSKSGRDLTPVF